MSQIARLPTERARLDPEAVFSHPNEIVEELLLTRGQKLATLERWRAKVLERRSIEAQGLLLPDLDALNADNELLKAIAAAEVALEAPGADASRR